MRTWTSKPVRNNGPTYYKRESRIESVWVWVCVASISVALLWGLWR